MTHEYRAHRVAIVGAGPAGIHASDALICMPGATYFVDLFDAAPAPIGLIRFATEHRAAPDPSYVPRLRLFGNLAVGTDITIGELTHYYDTVIVAGPDNTLTIVGTSDESTAVYTLLKGTDQVAVSRTPVVSEPSAADQPGAIVAFLEDRDLPFTTWTGWYRPALGTHPAADADSAKQPAGTHTVGVAQWSALLAVATAVPATP